MIVVVIIGIFAVLLAAIPQRKDVHGPLILSLFLIFIFLALRYDYGNDYLGYYLRFLSFNNWSDLGDVEIIKGYEWGWDTLNLAFRLVFGNNGFFIMVAMLAAIHCCVLYQIIIRYVPPQYHWFSIFMYVFAPSHLLVLLSAMRQCLAITIFLLAFDFLLQKKPMHYCLAILFACLFHTSALLLLGLVLLIYCPVKIGKIELVIYAGVLLCILFIPQRIFNWAEELLRMNFQFYSTYIEAEKDDVTYGLGALLALVIFIIAVWQMYFASSDYKTATLLRLAIYGFLLGYCDSIIPTLGRVSLYFIVIDMVFLPLVFTEIKSKSFRVFYITTILLFTFYNFYIFFSSSVWYEKYMEYQTLFTKQFPG